MKSTPLISHRLIAAAAAREDSGSPKPARHQTSILRLPDIATAIPMELLAAAEPAHTGRPASMIREGSAITF